MIEFSPGSQIAVLITLLAIVGEYPVQSLALLGNARKEKELVSRLTEKQLIRNTMTGEKLTVKVLTVSGKKPDQTIRLRKGALPLLDWIHAREYYGARYGSYPLSRSRSHVERNHRVAETLTMLLRAGIECRPWMLPKLQLEQRSQLFCASVAYPAKEIKRIAEAEMNKTKYTRYTAAILSPETCLVIYNTRNAVMKWNGQGEYKTRQDLMMVARLNAGHDRADTALLLGRSYQVALNTIWAANESDRFDSIYPHVLFIPFGGFGIRLLALMRVPDWQEKILDLAFEPEARSYNKGSFEYDACVEGRYVFSFLDSDLARLIRFRDAVQDTKRQYTVLCYPEQLAFLRSCLPCQIELKALEIAALEEALGLEQRGDADE